MATADRNLAIAHMLRNYAIIVDEAHAVVEGYTRQCSITVNGVYPDPDLGDGRYPQVRWFQGLVLGAPRVRRFSGLSW